LHYDPQYYPYPSRRQVVYAANGMVATSQALAAQAGLAVLQRGGNAIDAAVAAAACLTVVEPTSNGIGGDAFALVWTRGKLHGLNASGPAPGKISAAAVKKAGHSEMPAFGWIPVNVPGAPAAWAELSDRFGRLPLTETLGPAADYAERGYPVSPVVAGLWKSALVNFREKLRGEEYSPFFSTFAPGGRAPEAGEIWRSPDHARTLRSIAETRGQSFYRGELADRIDSFAKKHGGFLSREDLESYRPEWVDPISICYRGNEVWEIPPNGQGLVALLALNILKGFEFRSKDSPETLHRQIEAIKLAFADGKRYITDPQKMRVKVSDLLSEGYAAERRKLIGREASLPEAGRPRESGTVYLAAADREGNMISYIQSNYKGFGSGLVVPETGISLQNRGCNFSLDPGDDNCLEPGKKCYHTIIPGFLTRDGRPVGPFGVMGGFMQPQGHVQVIMNTIDFQLNPQAALDAPRWNWLKGKTVDLESSVPSHLAGALARMGHRINLAADPSGFGRGQIIWQTDGGVLAGGSDPRADGMAAAW